MPEPVLTRESLPRCFLSSNGNLGFACDRCEGAPEFGHLRMLTHMEVVHDDDYRRAANFLSNAAYYAGLDAGKAVVSE